MAEPLLTNSVINFALPSVTPDGVENPETRAVAEMALGGLHNIIIALEKYLGITQKDMSLWSSLTPQDTLLTHQLRRLYLIAGETLSFGSFINLYNDSGICKARKADASSGSVKPCHGFCSVTGGATAGNRTEVILGSGILAVSGLNPGQAIYLSTTPGTATVTAPTGAGQLEQFLGIGVKTNLAFINMTMGPYVQH